MGSNQTALDLAEDTPRADRRLLFDATPEPGDTVLIVDRDGPRYVVFDDVIRPAGPVWIVAVVRLTATLVLLSVVC